MSNLVLYRKYRPQKFAEVINQEHVKTTLANAVSAQKPGHAYLFTGPRGVGKTTIARIFARAVNCPVGKNGPPGTPRTGAENEPWRTGEPCNECEICKSFQASSSLDLLEIDAASHTGVDNIREIIDHLKFSPTSASYKVIIIDEVHMLSKGAFNALLKTLEEPPKHAIFILATTEVHKVPATIISRTQRFDFKKVTLKDLVELLRKVLADLSAKADDEALVMIAQAADGSFRDGLSLLDQILSFSSNQISTDLVEQVLGLTSAATVNEFLGILSNNDSKAGLDFVNKLVYGGVDLYQFLKDFLEYLRRVLLLKLGSFSSSDLTDHTKQSLEQIASQISLQRLRQIIEVFQKAANDFKTSPVQSLPLELAVVEITGESKKINPRHSEHAELVLESQKKDPDFRQDFAKIQTLDNQSNFEKIKQAWPQVLEKIKDYNHSLISSMKLANIKSLEGNELILLFPYKFHQDAIAQRKNRIVIDQAIEEITGIKVMVKPVLAKDIEHASSPVESALKILGGEVEK
ncbi:MAG: DNA polymerase III subunit gamma/tau [Candidatus Doudnabacteria bacterium]|nr:DNA polymerase III subunit gamma/tau [Candidatus Doudnabacteria bacterium]